ncbi:MAG TPA: trehalose-6-phosphate synthase [Candidatus Omnitrophota bacterium]|nr:trehalose-6-phosphate synthase [Candidatus Omnitrophota bacterium]
MNFKVVFRLVGSLTAVVLAVALYFAFSSSHQEQLRLLGDIEKRAVLLADGISDSLKGHIVAGRQEFAQKLAEKFSNREKILGLAVQEADGKVSLFSPGVKTYLEGAQQKWLDYRISNSEQNSFSYFSWTASPPLHIYSAKLDETTPDGGLYLTVYQDASIVKERVTRIWIVTFVRVGAQVILIILVCFAVIYTNITAPIRDAVYWLRGVRLGKETNEMKASSRELLGPLADEVGRIARSLQNARIKAEKEARLRNQSAAIWTPERLKELVKDKLEAGSLYVIANREPYIHEQGKKGIECMTPASGLVTAIEPLLKACGGTWVAHGSGNADKEVVDQNDRLRVPSEQPEYTLRRVWLSEEEEKGYYYGFSNEGLWPLCHIAHHRPIFRVEDWNYYQSVNRKFADALLEEIRDQKDPVILVQDYHFALISKMIKESRPDARIAIFWHIPWPNPESFGICPWRCEILEGMLGADILGFHTQFHCNNFMETVDRFLVSRINYENFSIFQNNQISLVRPYPISIPADFSGEEELDVAPPSVQSLLAEHGVEAEMIGVGVDRLDYTKGLVERFLSLETFFLKHPGYIGRLCFVELGAPTRSAIPKYAQFMQEVEFEVDRINQRFQTKNWKPILFLKKNHSHAAINVFYKAAKFCFVSSLHDGMNLVAKEYVAARADQLGVLILSQFTGAAREMEDALIVNPYDFEQSASAIFQALEMSEAEQERRMLFLRQGVMENNIYRWAAVLMGDLSRLRVASS